MHLPFHTLLYSVLKTTKKKLEVKNCKKEKLVVK